MSAIFEQSDVPKQWAGFAKLAEALTALSSGKEASSAQIASKPAVIDPEEENRRRIEQQRYEERRRADRERARVGLNELIRSFEAVLDSQYEEPVQSFLTAHPEFLIEYLDGIALKSKLVLGDEFQTDFVVLQRPPGRTMTLRPIFIEIESASLKLFTKKGDPSSGLTHALRQVQDWKLWSVLNRDMLARRLDTWVEDLGREGLQSRYSGGFLRYSFKIHYVILAGRRHRLSDADRIRLSHMNDDWIGLSVATYDSIIESLAVRRGFWWDGRELRDDRSYDRYSERSRVLDWNGEY